MGAHLSTSAPLTSRWPLLLPLLVLPGLLLAMAVARRTDEPVVTVEPGQLLTVDREALAEVDLERVHAELVPSWVVARGGLKGLAAKEWVDGCRPDRNLMAIAERIHVLNEADPVLNGAELSGLVATWNAYLDRAGAPWRMEPELLVEPRGGNALALRTYRVIYDGVAVVGTTSYRTRLQRRADDTTLVEAYLGHVQSREEGVLLLHDRIRDYTLDEVWTLLGPDLHDPSPVERAFHGPLQRSVRDALGDDTAQRLIDAAPLRATMHEVVRSIHARHACGSQFLVSRLPWNGFAAADVARLEVHAAAAGAQSCPDVTPDEARALVAASHALRSQAGLQDALDQLTAWVAGAVVIHEARHAADIERADTLQCAACPPALGRVGVLETSAYVASFAAPGRGVVSMLQACELDEASSPMQVAAVRFLAERMGTTCEQGPPDDMVPRARGLEVELFGRYTPVDLKDFPVGLPVAEPR